MSHINVTINGRQYRMACEEGQEAQLLELAAGPGDTGFLAAAMPIKGSTRACAMPRTTQMFRS